MNTKKNSGTLLAVLSAFFCLYCCCCETQTVRIISPLNNAFYSGGELISFECEIYLEGDSDAGYKYRWDFGDGAGGNSDNMVYSFDRKGQYIVTLMVTDSYNQVVGSDSVRLNISSSRFIKIDDRGEQLNEDAAQWAMVYDVTTGLLWEVKRDRDYVINYSNPHDADNVYTWYDANPETNGGDPGEWGDGENTERFIEAVNESAFGGWTDWRMPTCDELETIQNRYRFNPAINTDFFSNTRSWYYWSSTTYEQFTYAACHIYFLGFAQSQIFTGQNHYGYKTISYLTRAVREYNQ